MKKGIKLFVLVLLPFIGFTQTVDWKICYGGSDEERAYEIIASNDGNFLLAGNTKSVDGDVSFNHGSSDYWVVKIDESGNILWEETYGGSNFERAHAIMATDDGAYIIAGQKNLIDGDPTNSDFYLVKFNESGTILWENTYGGSSFDIPYDIMRSPDDYYYVSGVTSSDDGDVTGNQSNKSAVWVVKMNASGTIVWENCYLINDCVNFGASIATPDNGLIFTADVCDDNSDFHIVRIDEAGEIIWQKTYGGSLNDFPHAIAKCYENSGYVVAGAAASNDGDLFGNNGSFDFWVIRIDHEGELLTSNCYGGSNPDKAYSVLAQGNSEILVAGVTESSDGDTRNEDDFGDLWIINTAYDGTLNWEISLGDSIGREVATSIIPTGDEGYLVAGYTCSQNGPVVTGNHGMVDFWVVKMNTSGNFTQNINKGGNIELFPNPTSGYLNLFGEDIKFVELVNISGVKLANFTENLQQLNLTGFHKGLYFLKIHTGDGLTIKRVVLE